jgi:hypothetical protein
MRRCVLVGGIGLLAALLAPPAGRAQDAKVEVKAVDYAGLGKAVKGLKGKIVVVDFWADT